MSIADWIFVTVWTVGSWWLSAYFLRQQGRSLRVLPRVLALCTAAGVLFVVLPAALLERYATRAPLSPSRITDMVSVIPLSGGMLGMLAVQFQDLHKARGRMSIFGRTLLRASDWVLDGDRRPEP